MRAWLLVSCFTLVGVSSCSDALTDTPPVGSAGAHSGAAGDGGDASGDAGNDGTTPIATAGNGGSSGTPNTEALAGDGGMGGSMELPGAGGMAPIDAAAGAAGTEVEQVAPPPGAAVAVPVSGGVTGIQFSPLTLTPSFSTTIHDYYVRCAAGPNALTLTTTDSDGPKTSKVTLSPDQALVVGDSYWVRCLPPDFPVITVTQPGTPTPGYYLLSTLTYGAAFDVHGVPVWYARGTLPINVDSPAVNTISFMRNATPSATTTPAWEVRDLNARTVQTITSPSGGTNEHEFRVLDNGNYLTLDYPLESGVDLTGLNSYGADEKVLDCEIEEVDPAGNLVWSWLASDHVDPKLETVLTIDTLIAGGTAADVFHCNAVEVDSGGNLLVSMRHTSSAFYVERATGKVLWKLGGTAYNKDGAALIRIQNDAQGGFSLQHDARFQPNGNVTLFDDHGLGTGYARGLELAIDLNANTATPVFQYLGSGTSLYEGSFRRYADGDSVIGWGYIPGDLRAMTEVDSNGKNVFDITFSGPNSQTYRAIKVPLSQLDISLMRLDTAH